MSSFVGGSGDNIVGLDAVPATAVLLETGNGAVSAYDPAANTSAARGTALLAAIAAATSGQTIHLGVGTFAIGNNIIDIPAGVTIKGSDKLRTIITSTAAYTAADKGVVLHPAGDDTVVRDLTIDLSANTETSTAAWGLNYASGQSQQTAFLNARLENVKIIGVTDGLLFYNGNPTTTTAIVKDVEISTKSKGIAVGDEGLDIELTNVTILTDGTTTVDGFAGVAVGIDIESADFNAGQSFRVKNSRIRALNTHGTPVETVGVRTSDSDVFMDSVDITTSAGSGTIYDLSRNDAATGTINVNASVTYSSTKALGTINRQGLYGVDQLDVTQVVTSQVDKTNSSTLTAVSPLTVNVAAGGTYLFEAFLFVTPNVTAGHKYSINGTATATAIRFNIKADDTAGGGEVLTSIQTTVGGSAGEAAAGTTGVVTRINGFITVNAAGTLGVRFAQNTATPATTSSVLPGSWLKVRRVS